MWKFGGGEFEGYEVGVGLKVVKSCS